MLALKISALNILLHVYLKIKNNYTVHIGQNPLLCFPQSENTLCHVCRRKARFFFQLIKTIFSCENAENLQMAELFLV